MSGERVPSDLLLRQLTGYGPHDFSPVVAASSVIRAFRELEAIAHLETPEPCSFGERIAVYDPCTAGDDYYSYFGKLSNGQTYVNTPDSTGGNDGMLHLSVNLALKPSRYDEGDVADMLLMSTIMNEKIARSRQGDVVFSLRTLA